jgi:WD40 repeat protein
VNCFGIFPDNDERLASGSYDTHIKLWDIKNKNNTGILKHHTKQINSIDISPDGRYLISGS